MKKISEQNNKIIKEFVSSFISLNNREPMESEIIDNLKDKIDVIKIKKILENGRALNIKNDSSNDENV
jgi:hypothetical protein